MANNVRVVVQYDRIPSIAEALRSEASKIVRKTAQDIAANAKANTSRVDTGAMKNGYQVEQEDDLNAAVFNTQDYHIHHELGAPAANISPSPMLVPAAEMNREPFRQAVDQMLRRL